MYNFYLFVKFIKYIKIFSLKIDLLILYNLKLK